MYNTKYILGFTNDLNELYEIYFDVLDYVGAVTELTGTDDALTTRSTAGDENKMEPILGTEALINIFVDENTPIAIADLIAQHDNDIRVTIYRDEDYSKAIFQGFVVVEDNSQPFLDLPYILSIRALDGLGLLKGVDLVDTAGNLFVGPYSIVSWIAQILYKTGQTMNLRTYFNFWESSLAFNIGPLEQVFLNAITFSEGSPNSSSTDPTIDINATSADDCYTALEKIVKCFRCRLFQEDGRWCLVNLYEYLNHDGFTFKEYSFGEPVDGIVPVTVIDTGSNKDYSVGIGKDQIVHPVNDDQVLYLKLATKWMKLTYNYDQSLNKICNQELTQGDRNVIYDEVISSSIIDTSIKPVVNLITQGYDEYCYIPVLGSFVDPSDLGVYPSSAPTFQSFIRNIIDELGYDLLRFAVIKTPGSNKMACLKASKILIDVGDILQISYSWRTRTAMTANRRWITTFVYLYGDDGTFWAMNCEADGTIPLNPTEWRQCDNNFRLIGFSGSPATTTDTVADTTQWTSVAINQSHLQGIPFAKAPISGYVEIIFIALQEGAGTDGGEHWFKDISVTVLPFLQGVYKELKGDYNYSASNNLIKQTLSEDVQISDSPKRYFKGALLKPDGLSLTTPTWGRAPLENFRFTQIMERIMYNHLYRMVQKIEGTFRGLVYVPVDDPTIIRPNGYLNSYAFTEADEPTKRFMLTSFEKNYGTGQWRGVFVETLADQNADGFIFPDNYKFSYIFQ